MANSKLPLQVRIKAGLIGGLIFALLTAGFEYVDDKDFSIIKFIIRFIIFGTVMGIIIRPKKVKK
ncbi:hypothetical protein [Winogradskyella tangerina]|uniref:hypothetical protein n=1 Tax=Winogradskyella tangerina TaxID=2023240 RepID=UPI000DBE99AD|nr:hypothetical protein [Winogradskyella tangerina]